MAFFENLLVTPFDAADGRLHSCTNKPLDFGTRKLIQEEVMKGGDEICGDI